MGARSTAREAALQMLFAVDAAELFDASTADRVIRDFWAETPGDPEGRAYADSAVRAVVNQALAVDQRIQAASHNWRLERMTRVDRNVLRLGAWELEHKLDVPRAVAIDQAVELAKKFGSAESGKFVNGLLDRIAEDLGRVDRDGAPGGARRAVARPGGAGPARSAARRRRGG